MSNMVVSCTNGRGINALRDVIFDVASQVRENTGNVAMSRVSCTLHPILPPPPPACMQWLGVASEVGVSPSTGC